MLIEPIKFAIPHREPFLLVDEIVEQSDTRIVCRKTFTGDEFWYRGHYPGQPITPGVILCEAALQAGAALMNHRVSGTVPPDGGMKVPDTVSVPVVTRMNNVKFKALVLPGDTIEIEVELAERLADAFYFKAKVSAGGKTAATLDFACKLAEPD